MSKRRKRRSWNSRFRSQGTGIQPQRPKMRNIEKLEDRCMFSAEPTSVEVLTGPAAIQAVKDSAIDLAFQHAANLSNYTAQQLGSAERWIVKTDGSITPANFGSVTGLALANANTPIANTYIAFAGAQSPSQIISSLDGLSGVQYFYPEVAVTPSLDSLPNDPYIRDQWHIKSTGQLLSHPNEVNSYSVWGADVRAEEAWKYTTGEGVVIGVVDDSLARAHPDIAPNYSAELSFDFNGSDPFPDPAGTDIGHGTAVGGIIAAAGDNGEGVSGIAYDATLAGIRLIGDPLTLGTTLTDERIYEALTLHQDQIDIYNNSWGTNHQARYVVQDGPFHVQALIDSAFLGRDGLGTIQVASSGNQAELLDNANHASFKNSPYVITVAGFGEGGSSVSYAEGGPSVFVTAPTGTNPPGRGILTTDLENEAGFNTGEPFNSDRFFDDLDYTTQMNGTSASSPAAAGVVALVVAAGRDNGIELTQRDVQHILALSARRIDPNDFGWQTNVRPLFVDPALDDLGFPFGAVDPGVPGGGSAIPWKIDPALGGLVSDVDPQFARPSNSAGFYVQDGFDYGYGHGAVDAGFAVELASRWDEVRDTVNPGFGDNGGTNHQISVIRHQAGFGGAAGNIPAAETLADGAIRVPGGLGGQPGFDEHWEIWLNVPDDQPEASPGNTRGGNYEFSVPPNMSIEWVEVTMEFDLLPDESSDEMRMTLISPDGTHSELTNWIAGGSIGSLTVPGSNSLNFTFSTNRHWGERTEGSGFANAITGELIEAGNWTLAIENWGDEPAHLASATFDFHGVMTPTDFFGNGGRIQGTIGVDTNEDGVFNFDGIIAEEVTVDADNGFTPSSETLILSTLDSNFEPMAAGVMVWVDLNQDGVRDENEPQRMTGADGNFHFDLPWNQVVGGNSTTYQVRFELPDGMTNLGPDMLEYVIGPQTPGDPDSVQNVHFDANFTLAPEPITFEGNVFSDFNSDGIQDLPDATIEEFRVFVDLNENGRLDFIDVSPNLVFDNGIDIPLEPMQITGPDGSFSIEVNTSDNMIADPFGNMIFFNDRYLGTEYYTLMLDARAGWVPTSDDVTAEGFASPLTGGTPAPSIAFHRMFVEAGETMVDLDFGVAPELGSISGFVFNDLNTNGTRQAGEGGLPGFTVYLDADNDFDIDNPDTYGNAEGAIVTGANGNYLFENLPAGIYDIYITPGPNHDYDDQTHPISRHHLNRALSEGQNLGDGTNTFVDFGFYDPTSAEPTEVDWGDLGGTFLTTSADGGPSHGIVPGFHLGSGVTPDADGQPDGGAALDTNDDGVTFSSPIVAGELVRIDVEANTNVLFLQGWVDFDDNGVFDANEHLQFLNSAGVPIPFAYQPRLDKGMNELYIRVPDAVMGTALGARFRYGEGGQAQFNQPNGPAILGEVEDYVLAATVSTSFTQPLAGDYDGNSVVDQGDYQVWKQTFGSQLDLRADGNGDGRISLADYTVWRDNLGAVALPVQTIMAPPVAAPLTVGSMNDFSTDGLGLIYATVEQASVDPAVAANNDATTTASVDFYYYELETQGDSDSIDLMGNANSGEDEALVLALEEEFGDNI